MSLYKLNSFLKENSHDVLDYWIHNEKIKYVRVISRKNGFIFFIKLSEYKIKVSNPNDFEKSNFYYLEETDNDLENLNILYDVFLCAFPEYKYKYLLFEGYYLMQEKDVCFQIKNMSNLHHFGFYLFLEIEWFYENVYIISHEIEKIILDIQSKSEKMYLGFVPNYKNFCNSNDIHKITNVWDYYQKNVITIQKAKELYLNICKSENNTIHDIDFNEKITDSDDLMFQETVRRSFQKKVLNDRLNKFIHLKNQIIQKLLFYHCIQWKIILKFLVLISKFTKLQSDFHNLVYDLESIIPKINLSI